MEEYPCNSDKSKTQTENEPPHEKQKPVVKGKATVRKKGVASRIVNTFLPDGINSFKERIVDEVIIPRFWDAVFDGLSVISGRGASQGRTYYSSPAGRFNYSNISNPTKASTISTPQQAPKKTYEYDDLVFPNRGDAESVLNEMNQHIYAYDMVRVSDLFEFAGVSCDYTAMKYGWMDISSAKIIRIPGGWSISLPKAMLID